jgi:uncharacterized protein (UPF0335 family)
MEVANNLSKQQLKHMVEKLERLEEEKANVSEALKEVFQESKSNGFDIKTIKQVLKLRKMDRDKLQEQDALIELYRDILEV